MYFIGASGQQGAWQGPIDAVFDKLRDVIDTDGTGFGQGRIVEGGYASDHKHDLNRMQFFYRLDEQFVEYNFAGIVSKIDQTFARP